MMPLHKTLACSLTVLTMLSVACDDGALMDPGGEMQGPVFKGGKPGGETAGNNLSFPVLWAEGIPKVVPGTPGAEPILNGVWWYQWGTNGIDPDVTPASCLPDPDNLDLCDDGIAGVFDVGLVPGLPVADNPMDLARAYLQKDQNNLWQAGSASVSEAPLNVHRIDWGDNLESVDWYTRSQVRTEVVLYQDLLGPMTEYEMRPFMIQLQQFCLESGILFVDQSKGVLTKAPGHVVMICSFVMA